MTEPILLLSGTAAACARTAAGMFFIARLLSIKKPGKRAFAAAVCAGCFSLLVSLAGWPEICETAFSSFLLSVCAGRGQKRMGLFLGIFYEIAAAFWQFLFAAWAGVLFRLPQFLDTRSGYRQLAEWLFLAVLAALVLYFRRWDIERKRAFRLASSIVLAGFLAVVTLSEQTLISVSEDELYMWTILSVVLLVAVLVFNMNRQYEVERELAEFKSQQASLLEHDYRTLSESYAVNAKLFHDFHNHIGVLRQLLLNRRESEVIRYLDELQEPVRNMADTVWTADETVDYLINSKAAAAEKEDVTFHAEVEFPRHTSLQGADLCAILGNLLDNALEASRKLPKGQRDIALTIRRVNQMLVIKVENSFAVCPVQEDGRFLTTKEGGLHGWGLKSVQTAAEKYDGLLQTTCEDGRFRAVVTLSYQGVVSPVSKELR